MKKIPITFPYIDSRDVKKVSMAAKNGWGDACFENIKKFEKKFKKKYDLNYVSATSSGTGALHLGLKALGLKKGDEVILPDTTWVSCANAILYVGAKPVFADIKEDTWCIDPIDIEKKITKKTKAIMAVHLYGNVCDMNAIIKIKNKYNLYLIEDAAESLGAKYNNKFVGSFGDVSIFSFHGTKTITTGEGGMFVCKSKKIWNNYNIIHNMGKNPKEAKYFFLDVVGLKYKISNLQAALGESQLDKVDYIIQMKKKIFNYYIKYFNNPIFKMNKSEINSQSTYWMSTLNIAHPNIRKKFKERLIEFSMNKNIHLRPFFYPLSSMPMYKNKNKFGKRVSDKLSKSTVNLPSGYNLKEKDIKRIYDTVVQFLKLEKINL
jgi:perosamine synthetase